MIGVTEIKAGKQMGIFISPAQKNRQGAAPTNTVVQGNREKEKTETQIRLILKPLALVVAEISDRPLNTPQ